jgi:hypothetical protein
MHIRRRVTSSLRALALLIVSIIITAMIAAAMLIDTLTATAHSASAPLDCMTAVRPVLHTMEFVGARC